MYTSLQGITEITLSKNNACYQIFSSAFKTSLREATEIMIYYCCVPPADLGSITLKK